MNLILWSLFSGEQTKKSDNHRKCEEYNESKFQSNARIRRRLGKSTLVGYIIFFTPVHLNLGQLNGKLKTTLPNFSDCAFRFECEFISDSGEKRDLISLFFPSKTVACCLHSLRHTKKMLTF